MLVYRLSRKFNKEKHIWQVYVTSEQKIELFCFFTIDAMVWIFIAVKNRYLNFCGFNKIRNDSKWRKSSWNELMRPTTRNNHSQSIFPYHVHNQTGFDNPFINGRSFIYLVMSKLSFTFEVFTRFQGSVLIKAAGKTNIWLHLSMPGQHQDLLL